MTANAKKFQQAPNFSFVIFVKSNRCTDVHRLERSSQNKIEIFTICSGANLHDKEQ